MRARLCSVGELFDRPRPADAGLRQLPDGDRPVALEWDDSCPAKRPLGDAPIPMDERRGGRWPSTPRSRGRQSPRPGASSGPGSALETVGDMAARLARVFSPPDPDSNAATAAGRCLS